MAVFLAILGIALHILVGIGVLFFVTLYELITDEEDYETGTEAYAFAVIAGWPIFLVIYMIALLVESCNRLEKKIADGIKKRIVRKKCE